MSKGLAQSSGARASKQVGQRLEDLTVSGMEGVDLDLYKNCSLKYTESLGQRRILYLKVEAVWLVTSVINDPPVAGPVDTPENPPSLSNSGLHPPGT